MKAHPVIVNITLTLADTEYSYELPVGTQKFSIKARGGSDLHVCLVTGFTQYYITLTSGRTYTENNIKGYGNTLYFKSTIAGEVAEIIIWK